MSDIEKLVVKPKQKIMYIMRGLPGSGKSYLVEELQEVLGGISFSADDFRLDAEGKFKYDPKQDGDVFSKLRSAVLYAANEGESVIYVDNTHSTLWEVRDFFAIARVFNYQVRVKDLFDGGLTDDALARRSLHVSDDNSYSITLMRDRWETDVLEKWLTELQEIN